MESDIKKKRVKVSVMTGGSVGSHAGGEVVARQMGEEQLVLVLRVTQECIPSMINTYQEEFKIPQMYYIGYKLTLFKLCMVRNMPGKCSNKNKTVRITRNIIAFWNNTYVVLAYLFLKIIKEMLQNACIVQGIIKKSHCIFVRAYHFCYWWIQNSLIEIYGHTGPYREM
jgi:hypothetical protein